jgi:ferredoxin-NADP reductase
VSDTKERRRKKQLDVMVAEVIHETSDTTTLVLFTGNEQLAYEAGHFITIDPHQLPGIQRWAQYLEHVKGRREAPRAYSLASAPFERNLAITIKAESYEPGVQPYPPLLSPILAMRTPVGSMLRITGFTGPYIMPADAADRTEHCVHVCAGSGIVPSYAILKQDLHMGQMKHTLLYSNKTQADVIFWRQLADLELQFPDRFDLIHTLTREGDDYPWSDSVMKGRLSRNRIAAVLDDKPEAIIFLCGPANTPYDKKRARQTGEVLRPKFFESVQGFLAELGIDKRRIVKESYG